MKSLAQKRSTLSYHYLTQTARSFPVEHHLHTIANHGVFAVMNRDLSGAPG